MKYFIGYIISLFKKNSDHIIYKIYPDFLKKNKKNKIVIGVVGINGKTMIRDILVNVLSDNGYNVVTNKRGCGLANTFIKKSDIVVVRIGKNNVLDIDYDYLIVTNIKNEDIDMTECINKIDTKMVILNGNDKHVTGINKEYICYGMDKIRSYYDISYNSIINKKALKIDFRYDNHICTYPLVTNNIFNIYNELSIITLLTCMKMNPNDIKKSLKKINIIESDKSISI